MEKENGENWQRDEEKPSHMPDDSIFYEKFVPIVLAGLAILTVIILLVAAGIAVGIIPY